MVRPRSQEQNLASPISDFAPPLTPDHNHWKIGKTMGQFLEPSHDGIGESGDVETSEMPFVMF
jgi:hypothetical protein